MVIALALVALGVWQLEWDMSWLKVWIGQHPVLGAGIYLVVVAASVVLLPFSSLPLLPFAAQNFGVLPTALLSAAGWWTGCLIAFQIARLGRRYLERITSMEAVDRIEDKIPGDVGFGGILPFAFVMSYASGQLGAGKFLSFALVVAGMVAAVLVIRRLWKAYR